MKITGKNLRLLSEALDLALVEVHNMIATCPDVIEYAEDIEEYEQKQKELQQLAAKVVCAIAKEEEKRHDTTD